MATRSRQRSSRGNKGRNNKGPKVAFGKSVEDRVVGSSQFLRLDDDEKFVGYALFDPDPGAEDNVGYVEYGEHWDNTSGRFVPCWGAKNGCIFCKAGLQPSQRAMAAFLVTELEGEELEEPEIKLFRMNWTMMQEWGDTLDEDGSTLGQKVRVKCISRQDGDYTTKFFEKDRLSKKELKAAQKDIPDVENILQRNLDQALQALRVSSIVEDDEDEDEEDISDEVDEDEDEEVEEKPKRGRGRPKGSKNKKKDEEEDEDEEDEEDEEEEDEDEETDEADEDEEDEDEEDEDEDEDEEDEDEEETSNSLDDEFTVVSANESELTMTLKELDSDLYFSQDIVKEIDWDEFKKGDRVKVVAEQDEDEDWVATEFEKVASKKKSGSKSTKKRGRGRPKKK